MPLSEKYNIFSYDSFDVDIQAGKITFHYSVDGKHFFDPVFELDLSKVNDVSQIEEAVFNLGLAELPSFYKAFVTPIIEIKAGKLSQSQIKFWKEVYTKGLGEFFYVNKLDPRGLFEIKAKNKEEFHHLATRLLSDIKNKKVLLPMGGGKDSIVSTEILKEKNIPFTWAAVELDQIGLASEIAKISGEEKIIFVKRDARKNFDKIIELNKQGAYNGHVPVSVMYAFTMALLAKIHGFTCVAVSNERSADTGNVEYLGEKINHQWSKSFEFERMCNEYIRRHISSDIYYFSLLRNLYEVQILEKFSKMPEYFENFASCPVARKIDGEDKKWCGKCSKCAFVFAGLSAFLEPKVVEKIFGKNLFDDATLLPRFEELLGLNGPKPFDCVGTIEESYLALYLAKQKYSEEKMPIILKSLEVSKGEQYKNLLTAKTEDHIIPVFLL